MADAKWRAAAAWALCTQVLSAPGALAGRSLILAMRRRYSGASETGRGGSGPPSAAEVRYRAESPSIAPAVYPARSTAGGTVARDPHRRRGIGAAGSSLASVKARLLGRAKATGGDARSLGDTPCEVRARTACGQNAAHRVRMESGRAVSVREWTAARDVRLPGLHPLLRSDPTGTVHGASQDPAPADEW